MEHVFDINVNRLKSWQRITVPIFKFKSFSIIYKLFFTIWCTLTHRWWNKHTFQSMLRTNKEDTFLSKESKYFGNSLLKFLKRQTIFSHNSTPDKYLDLSFCPSRFKTNLYSGIKLPQLEEFLWIICIAKHNRLFSGIPSKPTLEFVQGLLYLIEDLATEYNIKHVKDSKSNEKSIVQCFKMVRSKDVNNIKLTMLFTILHM